MTHTRKMPSSVVTIATTTTPTVITPSASSQETSSKRFTVVSRMPTTTRTFITPISTITTTTRKSHMSASHSTRVSHNVLILPSASPRLSQNYLVTLPSSSSRPIHLSSQTARPSPLLKTDKDDSDDDGGDVFSSELKLLFKGVLILNPGPRKITMFL